MIATELLPPPATRFPTRKIYGGIGPVDRLQAAIDQLVRYGAPAEPVERLLRTLAGPVSPDLRQTPDVY